MCANCGRRHTSWSHECSIRRAAKAKAAQARHTAPARFAQRQDPPGNLEQERGWRLVESKQKKLSSAAE